MNTSMQIRRWSPMFLLFVAAACSSGPRGPSAADGMIGPLAFEPPPVYALLGYRADLNLSSEQVAALDSIAEDARDEAAPLLQELQEQTGRRRGAIRLDEDQEPLVAEIRANHRRVSEAVAEVLTDEQRETVCRLFDRQRSPARGGARRQPQPSQAPRDSLRGGGPQPAATWTWCTPAAEESTT